MLGIANIRGLEEQPNTLIFVGLLDWTSFLFSFAFSDVFLRQNARGRVDFDDTTGFFGNSLKTNRTNDKRREDGDVLCCMMWHVERPTLSKGRVLGRKDTLCDRVETGRCANVRFFL